ncbi:MAG: exodeoxyribonuclease III [Planctomycetota bacterium]
MSFTVCTLNLNGIRAAEKRGFRRWLQRNQPDILCLQELRAQREQIEPELVSPVGYNSRWVSAEKKGYAGVALYTREAVDRYAVGSGLGWGDSEGRVLRGDLSFAEPLTVVSLYVPSGSSGAVRQNLKYEYLHHIYEHLERVLTTEKYALVCGDINIAHTELDIHNPRGNTKNSGFLPEERAWFTTLLAQGWVDVVRDLNPGVAELYSWWSNRGRAREKDLGWRLDYVLATPSLAARATRAWIQKRADLSDHAPVWAEFK